MSKTTTLVGVVALALAATLTLTLTATGSTPMERQTYQGMTAQQWSRAAHGWMRTARHHAAEKEWLQKRLGQRVRELLTLQRRFKAEPNRPPHYSQWLCIHAGEGAWNSNTGNGFYGGLQFMPSTWARNGGLKYASNAHLATPLQQMWIAENAWAESGGSFRQWPNTSRACGLS